MKEPILFYILLFTSIIIFTLSIDDAFALFKSAGTDKHKFGSETKNIVCGDKLCSELALGIGDIAQQGIYYDPRGAPGPGSFAPSQYHIELQKYYNQFMGAYRSPTQYELAMHDYYKSLEPFRGPDYYQQYREALYQFYQGAEKHASGILMARNYP